jgi:ribonuclease-3
MAWPDLTSLEERAGVTFANRTLLEQALVHRSILNEFPDLPLASNERLEFLGDAILGLIAAQYLFGLEPPLTEGEMTTVRAALVRRETLARWARALDLGDFLYLGRGEIASGGRDRPGLLASTFEAVVAAIAIDRGLDFARDFVLRFLAPEAEELIARRTAKDHKSRLQEVVQALRQVTPIYRVVDTVGPDHDRTYIVEALAGDEVIGHGSGSSKQIAEQEAAREALASLSKNR